MKYVYVLAMAECSFGEWSIYGVYSEVDKLKKDYIYIRDSEAAQMAYLPSGKKGKHLCSDIH